MLYVYYIVLASVTGAIPFIGPYWVATPAVLELWLIKDSPLLALLTIVLFLVPVFSVDNLINSEIQGYVHVHIQSLIHVLLISLRTVVAMYI